MPSFRISEQVLEVAEPVDEMKIAKEVLNIISKEDDEFLNLVAHNSDEFNKMLLKESEFLDEELIKMIACIELKDIEKAGRMAKEGGNKKEEKRRV